MGATISLQDKATIIGLSVGIGVSLLMLACIVWQFIRFRQQDKKRLEDDRRKKDANSLQARLGEVPYRLGEDIFPSTYPPYPSFYGDEIGASGDEYPIDVNVPIEIPVECPLPCEVDVFPEPRCGFFPVEESPYPRRPCMMPPPTCDCTCDADSEPPSRRVILAPIEPKPQPPVPSEPIIIYQPLPPPPPPLPPPPPPPPQQPHEREIIREIYFPTQPPPIPQPQPLPQPPPQRRGSWCGPDDWMRVKKVTKKKKQPKKKVVRKYEETESDSSDSSSSDEESISKNKRLTPYDLALPTRVIQIPQQPIQIPSTIPAPHPAIYFIQQPVSVPISAPAPPPPPPPAPAPPVPVAVPVPYPFPVPAPRNAFFAANSSRFDSGQYEEQEQRATVAGDECFDCSF